MRSSPSHLPHPPRCRVARARALLAACAIGVSACGAETGSQPSPPFDLANRRQVQGGDPVRGRELLNRYQCGSCHVVPGAVSTGTPWAPPLDAWGGRSTLAGVLPNDAPTLVRWLQDPQALVPDTRMPRLGVSEADARDLAAALMAMD
jgi:cytochrome c